MPLTGDAKRTYMREHMRQYRFEHPKPKHEPTAAAEPAPAPVPAPTPTPWEPTQAIVARVIELVQHRRAPHWSAWNRPGSIGAEMLEGLDFDGVIREEEWIEACLRLDGIQKFRRLEKKAERAQEAEERAKPPPLRCSFCLELALRGQIMIKGPSANICRKCHGEVGEMFAAATPSAGS